MRTSLIATVAALVVSVAAVDADGVFLEKRQPSPTLDPASHARDITEPAQKALLYYARGTEQLVLQVSYKGAASEFAWLVPTPSRPKVEKVDAPVFHQLHELTAPKVRFWFDADQKLPHEGYASATLGLPPDTSAGLDVHVLEEKTLGSYDIAVLRAGNAADLLQWLTANGYRVTRNLGPVLADYIGRRWVFTAMRINVGSQAGTSERLHEGVLESLKFTFAATDPIYPLKVSSLNEGKTDILLYVLADHVYTTPAMGVLCSIDHYMGPNDFGLADEEPINPSGAPQRLTKLSANLTADRMTGDLVLKRAATDDNIPIGVVSPPFLENLGATSLLLFRVILPFPLSLLVLGCAVLISLSGVGRRRWRVWLSAGVTFVMVGLVIGSTGGAFDSRYYASEGNGYLPAGVATLVMTGIIVVASAVAAIASRRRPQTAP